MHSFDASAEGCAPSGALVQAADGNFYGTANTAGINGGGTVFKITPSGHLTVLYSFCSFSNCADGAFPASLIQGTDGNFYGITKWWGTGSNCSTSQFSTGCGTLFKITPSGNLTTLYNFCSLPNCADGSQPNSLIQALDGSLYGTTSLGGVCAMKSGCGTVFRITSAAQLTTLYVFCIVSDCPDGAIQFH